MTSILTTRSMDCYIFLQTIVGLSGIIIATLSPIVFTAIVRLHAVSPISVFDSIFDWDCLAFQVWF